MNVGGWFIKLFEIETNSWFIVRGFHPCRTCAARTERTTNRPPAAARRARHKGHVAPTVPAPTATYCCAFLRQTAARRWWAPRWIAPAFKIDDPQQQPEGKMRRQRSSLRKGWPFPSRACGSVTLRGQSRTQGLSRVCVPVLYRPMVRGQPRARECHELYRWGAQWKVAACSRARP